MQTLLLLCVLFLCAAGCTPSSGNPKVPAGATSSGGKHAVIETDKGPIEMELFEAEHGTDSPITERSRPNKSGPKEQPHCSFGPLFYLLYGMS